MNNALTVSGLTKMYQDFTLDNVSFSVPSGSVVGLIGENGAGKSTTVNAVLGLIQKEAGQVSILGREELDDDIKEQIGVVFDGSNYPEILSPRKLPQQQSLLVLPVMQPPNGVKMSSPCLYREVRLLVRNFCFISCLLCWACSQHVFPVL